MSESRNGTSNPSHISENTRFRWSQKDTLFLTMKANPVYDGRGFPRAPCSEAAVTQLGKRTCYIVQGHPFHFSHHWCDETVMEKSCLQKRRDFREQNSGFLQVSQAIKKTITKCTGSEHWYGDKTCLEYILQSVSEKHQGIFSHLPFQSFLLKVLDSKIKCTLVRGYGASPVMWVVGLWISGVCIVIMVCYYFGM